MNEVACSCEACRAMCAGSTCLPTPAEARALIRAGHGARLATYRFDYAGGPNVVGPAPKGQEGARDLRNTMSGCTFFDGRHCELHDAGLKPLEGRLAHHDRAWQPIRLHVGQQWKGRQFDSVTAMLARTA